MTEFVDLRVVDGLSLPYEAGAEAALAADDLDPTFATAWADLLGTFPELSLEPLYDGEVDDIADLVDAIRIGGDEPPNPFLWFTLPCDEANVDAIATSVALLPFVSFAGRRSLPLVADPISYGTNAQASRTRQIQSSPTGVDAIYAWQVAGGTGEGVQIADIESGWSLTHEELLTARVRRASVFGSSAVDHGTSVAGILVASDNGVGMVGIVPAASLALVTSNRGAEENIAQGIRAAIRAVGFGGVILLEVARAFTPDSRPDIPVEFDPSIQEAIRLASLFGITVVEPAGNGNVDLDAFPFLAHIQPGSPTFVDSRAILVGAGEIVNGRPDAWRRADFSSFGRRVDCFASGSAVRAPSSNAADAYRQFGGTSAASAIVAGVVASIQGMSIAATGAPLAPTDIRRLLRDRLLGTLPRDEINARIGVMPDLRKLVRSLGFPRILPVAAAATAGDGVVIAHLDADNRLVRRQWTILTDWGPPLPLPTPSDVFELTDGQPAVISIPTLLPFPRLVHDAFALAADGIHHLAWDSSGVTGDLRPTVAPNDAVAQGRSLSAARVGPDLVAIMGTSPAARLVVMTGNPDVMPNLALSAPVTVDPVGNYRRLAGPVAVSRAPGVVDVVAVEDGGTLTWCTGALPAANGSGFRAPISDRSGTQFEPGARPALVPLAAGLLAAAVGSEGWLRAVALDPAARTIERPVEVDVQVTIATSGPVGLGLAGANVVALGVDTEGNLRAATRRVAGGDWTPLIVVPSAVAVSPLGGVTAVSLNVLGLMALVVGVDGVIRFSRTLDGLAWSSLQSISRQPQTAIGPGLQREQSTGDLLFSPPEDEPLPEPFDWSLVPALEVTQDASEVDGFVKLAQALLNAVGAQPPLVVDGNFGLLTQTATSVFQSALGLPATGAIDRDTWSTLSLAAPFALLEHGRRDPGMTGPPVAVLQELLAFAGAPSDLTGEFDQSTSDALGSFASSIGQVSNGKVDPAMWAAVIGAATDRTPTGSAVFTFAYDADSVANGQPILSFVGRIDNEDPGPPTEPLDATGATNDFRVEWHDTNGTTIYRRTLPNPIAETVERLEPAVTKQRTVIVDPHPQGAFAIRLAVPEAAESLAFFGTFGQGPQPTGAVLLASFNIGALSASAVPAPVAPPFPIQTFHGDLSDPRRRWTMVILAEGYTAAEIGQFTTNDGPDLAANVLKSPLFDDVRDRINIVGIPTVSNQSGSALQPPFAAPIDTFFRAQFSGTAGGAAGTRDLFGETPRVVDLLAKYDVLRTKDVAVAVIVNSEFYGGMGTPLRNIVAPVPMPIASIAWVSKFDGFGKEWVEIALHELGHGAFGLVDEYEDDDTNPAFAPAPGATDLGPNVTFLSSRAQLEAFSRNASQNRAHPMIRIWRVMIDSNTPTPSTAPNPSQHRFLPGEPPVVRSGVDPDSVGLFEGAAHRSLGVFRGKASCKMRDHNAAFCPVCQAQIGSVLDSFSAPRLVPPGPLVAPDLTHFLGFGFNDTNFALLYNSVSGNYQIHEVDRLRSAVAPQLPTPLSDGPPIDAGFSWLVPFEDLGVSAFLGFEFATGRHSVHHVVTSADGVHLHLEKVFEFTPAGVGAMTNVATFVFGGRTHAVLYNRFTGEIRIDRIDSATQPFTNVFSGSIEPGWTTMTTFRTSGGVFLLRYEVMTGTFKIQHLETLGATFTPFVVGDPVWTPGFTHILPYELNNRTYLLRHNGIRGRTSIVRARTDGSGADPRFEFDLPPGALTLFGTGMPSHVVTTLPPTALHPGTVLLATDGIFGHIRTYEM
jgi:hypothetical protein